MKLIEEIKNVLNRCIKQRDKYIFGIYDAEDRIFYCILHREHEGYRVALSGCYVLEAMETLTDGLEKIRLAALKQGIGEEKICITLPESRFFSYEKNFPNIDKNEIRRMIGWNAEANVPFEAGLYRLAYEEEAADEGEIRYKIFAMYESEIEWWKGVCSDAECCAAEFTVEAEGSLEKITDKENEYLYTPGELIIHVAEEQRSSLHIGCLSGAINYAEHRGVLFFEDSQEKCPFFLKKTVAGIICGLLSMTYIGIYGYDLSRVHSLEDELRANTSRELLVEDVLRDKAKAEDLEADINKRRNLIKKLADDRLPIRAILAEMGTAPVERAWFTDMQCSEGSQGITLKGCTDDYGKLSNLINGLKKIPNGHFQNVEIGKIEVKNGETDFELKLNV